MTLQHLDLPTSAPGTRRRLTVHRLGTPGARPKAYLQAALHADELPGALVLHHLLRLLADTDIIGEIVVVPLANPIGLDQHVMGYPLGRYDLAMMSNFNRGWPHLTLAVAARVDGQLGNDAHVNIELVRRALRAEVARLPEVGENAFLRKALLGRAVDADYVIDLHCDLEAVPHLYLAEALWPDTADLAALLGARAVLLADASGGDPFDEVFSRPWTELVRHFPDHLLPHLCLSTTIELRGQGDVGGAAAEADALALLRFLTRRGVVRGAVEELPPARCAATPLDRAAMVRAEIAGIIDYKVEPGDEVRRGQPLAQLVDPSGGHVAEIVAPTAGIVFARERARIARPGTVIAKIAGTEPLRDRGALLPD